MDFGSAFAIGSTLLSFVGGGKGDPTAGGGGMDIGDTSGGLGTALGFIQKGARAYNVMRGTDSKNPKPFQVAAAPETGKYYQRFKQSGTTQAATTPQAQTYAGYRNPDLSTAIANLVNNAQNTQMQQLMAQYNVVQPNKPVNRQITRTEPSVLSSIGVA
jgi:hypothetical protein